MPLSTSAVESMSIITKENVKAIVNTINVRRNKIWMLN
jgi:hypothetical protein